MSTKKKITWKDPAKYIRYLHVAEDIKDLPYTQEILRNIDLPVTVVPYGEQPQIPEEEYTLALAEGKKHLFLCRNRGTFFKPCPGTAEYSCCGYHVLNIGTNCPMDCVYCILQAYLNQPWITAFVNLEDMFVELDNSLTSSPDEFFRIGTGEFTDSLALENITGLSSRLIDYFSNKENAVLELKTKSGAIETLQHLNHRGRTILSWSLNSQDIYRNQELRTATLKERLDAARLASQWGYKLAFHFDPIVLHKNWQAGYRKIIEELFHQIDPQKIVWISMGALRFIPSLKSIGNKRFPQTTIFSDEFISGLDGKSRYFRTQREEMYSFIYSLLRSGASEDTCIYFCMESEEMWENVMGYSPQKKGGLATMLDDAARSFLRRF